MEFEIKDYNTLKAALQEMCLAFAQNSVPEEAAFGCKLVADELLSNVLQHGGKRALFRVRLQGNEITLCVKDEGEYRPPEKSILSAVTKERGRGLFLVDAYCVRREYSEEEGVIAVLRFE